ncbi:MAG: glycosyltransferase family 4 protein [Treponema sp.]|nr:glycosyltransferase family 4 protein [Treponema sp.]
MKIIIHTGISYPDGDPCLKRIGVFYDEFKKHGHSVIFLAPRLPKGVPESSDTVYCPCIQLKKKTTLYRLLNSLSFAFTSIFKSFSIGKADVVITTSPPPLISISAWLIAKFKRAKLVYDVRDIWPDVAWEMGSFEKKSIYSRVFAFIRNFMLSHSDLVTTVSPGKIKKLKNYCPKANVIEVSNGLDEHFLENTDDIELVKNYGLDDSFICSYIGNIGLAQGCSQLIDLAVRAKDKELPVRFVLFGSGAAEESLRSVVNEKHLDNVSFMGRVPNKKVYSILLHSDICFISLVNERLTDSIPTKMYEALGVGCPVLLAACGDSVDILYESHLGYAAKPNDIDSLWKSFLLMYSDNKKIKENSSYSKKLMLSKYSRQKAVEALEEELLKILDKSNK